MKELKLEGSNDKPFVRFNGKKGFMQIGGVSLPENVLEAYHPILTWLERYMSRPREKTFFEFFFDYLNTSSVNIMMRIVELLERLNKKTEVKINWCYLSGDFDMKDLGIELLEESTLSYEIVEKDQLLY